LVEKNLDKRMDRFLEERWRDMGAVFLTFAVYTTPDGRYAVEPFDRMADMMNVKMESFISRHKDKVNEIKRLLMNYVKELRQWNSTHQPTANVESTTGLQIHLSDYGYPSLPKDIRFDEQRKGDLDKILRSYLACHYSKWNFTYVYTFNFFSLIELASGKDYAVPYKNLEQNTSRFVDKQYIPANFKMKDPKKLTKGEILKLLKHILDRQESHGVVEAFRFQIYQNKKGTYCSEYPDYNGPAPTAKKKNSKKKPVAAAAQINTTAAPRSDSESNNNRLSPLKSSDITTQGDSNSAAATGRSADVVDGTAKDKTTTPDRTGRREVSADADDRAACSKNTSAEIPEAEPAMEGLTTLDKRSKGKGKKSQKMTPKEKQKILEAEPDVEGLTTLDKRSKGKGKKSQKTAPKEKKKDLTTADTTRRKTRNSTLTFQEETTIPPNQPRRSTRRK
jgi:hypothetical protein